MLANNLAKAVANLRPAMVSIGWLRRKFRGFSRGLRRLGEGSDFLSGTDANPIGLSQGTIHRPGFRNSHFCAMDKERDIRRIGVAVTDKAGGTLGRVNCCLQDEPTRRRITKSIDSLDVDATAFLSTRQPQQPGMCYVPVAVNNLELARLEGESEVSCYRGEKIN